MYPLAPLHNLTSPISVTMRPWLSDCSLWRFLQTQAWSLPSLLFRVARCHSSNVNSLDFSFLCLKV